MAYRNSNERQAVLTCSQQVRCERQREEGLAPGRDAFREDDSDTLDKPNLRACTITCDYMDTDEHELNGACVGDVPAVATTIILESTTIHQE